jgi:gas vesicle protein
LQSTHQLRREIETSKQYNDELFAKYPPEVVSSVLKLYLLELPDSLVSNQVYDLIKSIYNQFGSDDDERHRINGIINVLKELNRPNIATLNALCTHFQRLISILREGNKDNEGHWKNFQNGISREFSNCILRPRTSNNLNITDLLAYRFLNDLLKNKTEIFKELKNNLTSAGSSVSLSKQTSLISRHQSELKRRDSSLQTRLKQAVKQGTRKASDSQPVETKVHQNGERVITKDIIAESPALNE